MKEEDGMKAKETGIYFNIKNCPQGTFARFHKFCDDVSKEAGLTYASYPLGLKKLLDEKEQEEVKENKEEGVKTFGGEK